MKKIWATILFLMVCSVCYGAGFASYTADTSPTSDDLVLTCDNPSAGCTTKKLTLENLFGAGLGNMDYMTLPSDAAPTTDAVAEAAFETDAWAASRGTIRLHDGTDSIFLVGVLSTDAPSNGQVPVWSTGGTITWETQAAAPTGTDTRCAFFDGTTIGHDAGCTYNKTLDDLTIAGIVYAGSFSSTSIAVPVFDMKDVDGTDDDINGQISGNLTDTGSGTEDFDIFIKQQIAGTLTTAMTFDADGNITSARDFAVPDEAYDDSGWNGDLTVPTKNAVRDKIATMTGGGATSFNLPIYSAKLTGAFTIFTPPTGDACTAGAAIDAGLGPWRLLFDATTDECATWQFVMPNNYASDPLIDIIFSMASGEANEVQFEAAIMCYTPTTDTADIATAGFSNVAVGTTTVSATAGEAYLQTITLTDDACAAGDQVFVVISTDADDATNDDATGDREVIGVNLRYTGA